MFEDISEKFKKLKVPEESLIKKIERIKKTPDAGVPVAGGTQSTGTPPIAMPDLSEQVKKAQEEITQKIEEIVKSKTEQISATTESIKEYDTKISKVESAVSSTKNRVDEFKDRLDKIDESLLELLSLYEVVSSTVNPFVGDKENVPNEKIEQMEKKIEALSQKAPELPLNIKEEYDIKFKALEASLQALTDVINSTALNQDVLVKNVSERVLEEIKPLLDQKSLQPIMVTEPSSQILEHVESAVPATKAGGDVKLQYLDNKAETSIILLNWIEFLLEKVGRNNLTEVLEYYIDIGWISEEVCEKMIAYANGIDYYVERPTWKLLPDDHTKSLMFIEQLKGRKLDKTMLSKLERDVEKVVRSTEVYIS
jgi:flagellar protein FlaD